MRKMIAVVVALAGCGGHGPDMGLEATGGAPGTAVVQPGRTGVAGAFVPAGAAGGSAGADMVAMGGIGGQIPPAGGTAGQNPADGGTGGADAHGGQGGDPGPDLLGPYQSPCDDWTVYGVPAGECLVVQGRFTVWPGSEICDANGDPPVRNCTYHSHVDQCPIDNDWAGLCDAENNLMVGLKADPDGHGYNVQRGEMQFDKSTGRWACSIRCP